MAKDSPGDDIFLERKVGYFLNENEWFSGQMINGFYHGKGSYKWENNSLFLGHFYCNTMEGYASYYYPNGTQLQGIFMEDRPFGPGVLSYPTGKVDVGYWDGKLLCKLIVPVWEINLTQYFEDRTEVTPTRKPDLIPLKQTEKIKARLLNKSDYLPYIRNRNSLAFNKKRFDDMYLQRDTSLPFERKFGAMNGIEVNLDSPENPDYPREERKQQCIKAWNSSSRMKCIQLVAYKFRHQQQDMEFDISNVFQNRRKHFGDPGDLENCAMAGLVGSILGEAESIKGHLIYKRIDVNLQDCLGNSLLLLASVFDNFSVAKLLVEEGADVNHKTDEGISILTAIILIKYPPHTYKFLDIKSMAYPGRDDSQDDELSVISWNGSLEQIDGDSDGESSPGEDRTSPTESDKSPPVADSLVETVPEDATVVMSAKNLVMSQYVQVPEYSMLSTQSGDAGPSLMETLQATYLDSDERCKYCQMINLNQNLLSHSVKVDGDLKVFKYLLNKGAEINTPRYPLPILFLLFLAEDYRLIINICKHFKGDPNVSLDPEYGKLTMLHLAANKRNSETIKFARDLIQVGADPNLRAVPDNVRLIQPYLSTIELSTAKFAVSGSVEDGKAPIHVVASSMKDKGVIQLANVLLEEKGEVDLMYNGQTPLALAIYNGNLELIELLFQRGAQVNRNLGPLGNYLCLAVAACKNDTRSLECRKRIVELLLNSGINVTGRENIPDFGLMNVMDYLYVTFDILSRKVKQKIEVTQNDNKTMRMKKNLKKFIREIFKQRYNDELKQGADLYSICNYCGKSFNVVLRLCVRCLSVSYCSRECVHLDWAAGHQKTCSQLDDENGVVQANEHSNRHMKKQKKPTCVPLQGLYTVNKNFFGNPGKLPMLHNLASVTTKKKHTYIEPKFNDKFPRLNPYTVFLPQEGNEYTGEPKLKKVTENYSFG